MKKLRTEVQLRYMSQTDLRIPDVKEGDKGYNGIELQASNSALSGYGSII